MKFVLAGALAAALSFVAPAAASAEAAAIKAGALTLSALWARATPPGAKAAGAYLSITNAGAAADRLVSVTTEVAGVVEIHEMAVKDGIMTMRALDKGLPIGPGETVALKPGGFHVMLLDLKKPLVAGETVKATLRFETAGAVAVEFAVAPIGAAGPAAGGHGHGQGH